MMKKLMMTGLTAAFLSSGAIAGNVADYTAPSAGQAATAASVDANFQALITAINDNNARIEALESFDVGGKTYSYKEIGILNAAERIGQTLGAPGSNTLVNEGFARTGLFSASGDFVFNTDGTFALSLNENEIEMFVNSVSDIGPQIDGPLTDSGNWVQTGSSVTLNFAGGGSIELSISRGATAFTLVNQGVGDVLTDQCRLVDTTGNGTPDTEACIHEYQSNLGIGLLAE